MNTFKNNTAIYWRDSNGNLTSEVCCKNHLLFTLMNVQKTEKLERSRLACDSCEHDAQVERNEADRDGRLTEASERRVGA